jgi:uncharacterized protein (DUF1015 family)
LAKIRPFQPYCYTPAAGDLGTLVTQPYDKISPAMQARYQSLSPYNLVRIILGERFPGDNETANAYTRAAAFLDEWIRDGILAKESEPAFYAYFQQFQVPDAGVRLTRKGFIGLGAIEDYAAGIVHRHEQTLSGPKKDRTELLNHTRAHFGQIFMLYPDQERAIDSILDHAAAAEPDAEVTDEFGTVHRLWRIVDPAVLAEIEQLMADKKLLIADGHHRYETALAFRDVNPALADAKLVMMTFVNMYSEGLMILATHRLVNGLEGFDFNQFVERVAPRFSVFRFATQPDLLGVLAQHEPRRIRIGVVTAGVGGLHLLEAERRPGDLDVQVLHEALLGNALGIGEEAVREEQNLRYIRGAEAAIHEVRGGRAQVAFLLQPTSIEQVAEVSFSGGVMPQKSTDFYPKLLSGLTIYKLEK